MLHAAGGSGTGGTQERKKPPEGGLVYQGGVKEDPAKTSGVPNNPRGLFDVKPRTPALKYG